MAYRRSRNDEALRNPPQGRDDQSHRERGEAKPTALNLFIEESRHTYTDLFVNAPIPIVTIDGRDKIRRVNHAAVELLRIAAHRLDGLPFANFVSSATMRTWREHMVLAKSTHRAVTAQICLLISDRLIEVRAASAHLADDGECVMIVLVEMSDWGRRDNTIMLDQARASAVTQRHGGTLLRILLVEDDEELREITAHMLRMKQYDVMAVGTMADAHQAAEKSEFDVVVSDIRLPDGSGLDLMRQLHRRKRALKGIALSGFGDAKQAKLAGFAMYLRKPVAADDLNAILRRLCFSPTVE